MGQQVTNLKKRNKNIQNQKYALKHKLNNLSNLLGELKHNYNLCDEAFNVMETYFRETELDLFKVHLNKKKNKKVLYTDVKKFAMTLFSYSRKHIRLFVKSFPCLTQEH